MRTENIVKSKTYLFSLELIKTCQEIQSNNREYILTKQLIRRGTAIGALVRESEYAESLKDFIHKLSIALKEANETEYWLDLLRDSSYVSDSRYKTLRNLNKDLLRLLIAIIKSSKKRLAL